MATDIFTYNVQYQNDVGYTNMQLIAYHVLHSITFNMKVYKTLIKRLNVNFESANPVFSNAGYFYNYASINSTSLMFTDDEFMEICTTFKNSILETNLASSIRDMPSDDC